MEVLDMDFDYDLNRICRSCCRDDQDLHPIFEPSSTLAGDQSGATLYEMLTSCTQLQIKHNDGMPPNMCSVCVTDINVAYDFRKRSEQSDALLREYLSRRKMEIDGSSPDGEDEVKEEPLDIKPDVAFIDEDPFIGEKCFVAALPVAKPDQSDEIFVPQPHNDEVLEDEECSDVEDDESKNGEEHSGEGSLDESVKEVKPKAEPCMGYSTINEGSFRCDSCQKVFLDRRGITNHIRKGKGMKGKKPKRYIGYTMINGDNFECDTCKMDFTNRRDIKKHVKQHKPKENIKECTLCDQTYKDKPSYARHMKSHENGNIQCDQCETKFCSHKEYRKHMILKHPDLPIQVQQKDDKQYQTYTQMAEMVKEQDKMEVICRICDTTFDRIVQLRNHLETHVDPETFTYVDIQTKPYLFEEGCVPDNYQDIISQQILKWDVHRLYQIVQPDGEELELSDSDSEPEEQDHRDHICELCNQYFPRIKTIVEHAKSSHRFEDLIACRHCSRGFPNNALLIRHLRQQCENHSKKFSCSICNEKFMWQTSLNKHAQSKHKPTKPLFEKPEPPAEDEAKDKKFVCQICQKAFIRLEYLERHIRIHLPSERKFECAQCHKKFNRKHILEKHMNTHKPANSQKQNHLCVYCGRGFDASSNLIVHMRRHTGEQPFKCDVCDKGFPRLYDLKCHRMTHTGEKSCQCTVCGKGFYRSTNLVRHMRIHTGEKPFACTYCDRTFSQSNNLTEHLLRHTGEKPYVCEVCNMRFILAWELKAHQRETGHLGNRSNTEDGLPKVVKAKVVRRKAFAAASGGSKVATNDTVETSPE